MKSNPVISAHVMPVICIKVVTGDGTQENPTGIQAQYWSLDGTLLTQRNADITATNELIQGGSYGQR